MSCAVCGTVLVPGARFCYHCGTPQDASGVEDAERRRVTVLFGDLSDFTSWAEDLDPERVGVVTDRVLAALAQVVSDIGGYVDKLTGDGIMAVFGAPVAHEDDAERALRAAAAMQEKVARLVADESGGGRRLGLRVGLNTGVVLAGVQGQLSYTVVGDTVNTASRLSDAAVVGGIYAGRDTAKETARVASWRPLPPLHLKGKRELFEAYEFVALRPGGGRRSFGDDVPLIGREAELGALVGHLRVVVEERQPATLFVNGDVGVGKSKIVSEFARVAQETYGARVAWGYCSPYGQDRDLEPLVQVLRTFCGIEEGDPQELARERVRKTVVRVEPYNRSGWPSGVLEERIFRLIGIEDEGSDGKREWPQDATTAMSRANPQELEAFSVLVSAISAQSPVVVVIEDIHYARPPLLDALRVFGDTVTGRVMSIGLSRTYDLAATLMRDRDPSVVLQIKPLDFASMERVLRAYLNGTVLPSSVRTGLIDRVGGNPFFLAELLGLLRDRGLLVRDEDSSWNLVGTLPRDALPVGVQSVLAARIDSLDPVGRALLRDASVAGVSFSAAMLPRLDPRLDPATVDHILEGIASRGLVVPAGSGRWRFAHSLARDVAYEGLTKVERARRHATIALMAAENSPGSTELNTIVFAQAEQAARLATEMALPDTDQGWSAGRAGVEAGIRLGLAALRRDDNLGAERVLQRVLELAKLPQIKRHVPENDLLNGELWYAAALSAQRRTDEVEPLLAPLLAAELPGIRAGALTLLGEVRARHGDREGARSAFVQAFALAGESGRNELTGIAMRRLGLLDLLDGRPAAAEGRFKLALEFALQVQDDQGAAWALQHLTLSSTVRGEFAVALGALSQARGYFRTLQDTGGETWCDGTEALVCLLQGRAHKARVLVEGVLPRLEGMGAHWESAVCRCIDGLAALGMGEVEAAISQLSLAESTFNRLDDIWGRVLVAIGWGAVYQMQNENAKAVESYEEAERIAAREHHRPLELTALSLLGMLHLHTGDVDAAEATARRMESHPDDGQVIPDGPAALWVLRSAISKRRGDLDKAYEFMLHAVSEEGGNFLYPRQQALASLALIELARGHLDAAAGFVERGLATPSEGARSRIVVLRAQAELLAAQGRTEEAAAIVEGAFEIALRAGNLREIEVTRTLLQRLAH